MNFYEKELRAMFEGDNTISEKQFAGRVLLGRLGDKLLVKVQFIPSLAADHYNSLQVLLLNWGKGFVDKENFLFRDMIGSQRREDLGEVEPGNCRDHKRILAGNQPDGYMYLYSRLPTARCGSTAAGPPGLFPSPRPSARRSQTRFWGISGCSRAKTADP